MRSNTNPPVSFDSRRTCNLVVQLTASLMKNQKGWRKDRKLSCLEFDIQAAITKVLREKGIEVSQ